METRTSRSVGWPIAAVRTGLELSALVGGGLLGGTVGIGTAVFAFGVGPALAMCLRLVGRYAAKRRPSARPAVDSGG